ncbi:MAG: ATP-binding cassette domain-containing protein [candidate division Zixibacteria bacterium]|nr:ATP-binding cassette domain-containing protein [candidate division Zixibacteria bacterium]
MAVIMSEKICKTYNDGGVPVKALKDVDMEIEDGEFTAIVGPSGSGKTTLLNVIGGLDTLTSGKLRVGDKEISEMTPNDLIEFRLNNIGFVFQAYNLIPVLTAIENVEFIMLLQKVSKEERRGRARELLKSVGLEDMINRKPIELSGGQQQRVAVARALASRPRFVLADEPTANLDTASAENLLDIMERMNDEHKMTFIFSTHDQRVVRRARRVITLKDGQVDTDERKGENG